MSTINIIIWGLVAFVMSCSIFAAGFIIGIKFMYDRTRRGEICGYMPKKAPSLTDAARLSDEITIYRNGMIGF